MKNLFLCCMVAVLCAPLCAAPVTTSAVNRPQTSSVVSRPGTVSGVSRPVTSGGVNRPFTSSSVIRPATEGGVSRAVTSGTIRHPGELERVAGETNTSVQTPPPSAAPSSSPASSSASSSAGSYSPTYLQARDLTASASPSQPKAANNPLQAGVGDGLGQGSVAARESDFSRIGADSAQRQQTAVDMQRDIAERREGSLMQALKKRGLGENISPETQKKINQILKQ